MVFVKMEQEMAADSEQTWPRKEEAKEYLEKHKITDLFDNLTSQLIYHQPGSPKEFMVEQLEKLAQAKASRVDYPCIFDETNIHSVAQMMDPTGRGFITHAQYKEAMVSMGVTKIDDQPAGADSDKITIETFVRDAKLGLSKSSATFYDKR